MSKLTKVKMRVNTAGIRRGTVVEVDEAVAARLLSNGHAALVKDEKPAKPAKG